MSYWMEDGDGEYLGEFGSVAGTAELLERDDALGEFVKAGVADEEDIPKIIEACGDSDLFAHIKEALSGDVVAPVIITNGVE